MDSLIEAFLNNGGTLTTCPTRKCQGWENMTNHPARMAAKNRSKQGFKELGVIARGKEHMGAFC